MIGMKKGLMAVAVLCGILQCVQAQDVVRVDINVGTKRTTYNIGAGNQGESKVKGTTLNVTLRKSSSMPYAGQLTAELYVLGKRIHAKGVYGVIDVLKPDFTFSTENGNEFKFTAGPYHLEKPVETLMSAPNTKPI